MDPKTIDNLLKSSLPDIPSPEEAAMPGKPPSKRGSLELKQERLDKLCEYMDRGWINSVIIRAIFKQEETKSGTEAAESIWRISNRPTEILSQRQMETLAKEAREFHERPRKQAAENARGGLTSLTEAAYRMACSQKNPSAMMEAIKLKCSILGLKPPAAPIEVTFTAPLAVDVRSDLDKLTLSDLESMKAILAKLNEPK